MIGDMFESVVRQVIPDDLLDENPTFLINPSGRFEIGGPMADAGLTGIHVVRKAGPLLGPGTRVVVVGIGGLGHIGIQCLAALTSTRIVVARS